MLNCQSYGRCENGQNWAHVVRRVRSKKRNDGSALGVVYAPLVAVMHAGFSTTLCSRHTYIHANRKQIQTHPHTWCLLCMSTFSQLFAKVLSTLMHRYKPIHITFTPGYTIHIHAIRTQTH